MCKTFTTVCDTSSSSDETTGKIAFEMILMDQQWVMPHIQLDQSCGTNCYGFSTEKSLMLISDLISSGTANGL